ncbi:MAG: hypothetical protein SFZ03_08835 [Candidatus Melainabacteria bacterium]|nr:hypothetical protein [Candidatus Melainabacteria bacterium]
MLSRLFSAILSLVFCLLFLMGGRFRLYWESSGLRPPAVDARFELRLPDLKAATSVDQIVKNGLGQAFGEPGSASGPNGIILQEAPPPRITAGSIMRRLGDMIAIGPKPSSAAQETAYQLQATANSGPPACQPHQKSLPQKAASALYKKAIQTAATSTGIPTQYFQP